MDKLLSQIRIVYRPLLIVAALLLPLAGLFYFMMAGFSRDIKFAQMEIRGNLYQRPLEQLLKLLPEHQRLALRGLAGDGAAATEQTSVSAAIDKAFDALAVADQAVGRELQFTDEAVSKKHKESVLCARLRKSWDDLKSRSSGLSAESYRERNGLLLKDIRSAIAYAGDSSNLILDPDLDSFYLMDATLVALPSAQERVAYITDMAIQPGLSDAAKQSRFAVFAAQLREIDVDRVLASLQTCLSEDANFNGESPTLRAGLDAPQRAFQKAAEEFLALLDKQAASSAAAASPEEIQRKGETLRGASFALWDAGVQELG